MYFIVMVHLFSYILFTYKDNKAFLYLYLMFCRLIQKTGNFPYIHYYRCRLYFLLFFEAHMTRDQVGASDKRKQQVEFPSISLKKKIFFISLRRLSVRGTVAVLSRGGGSMLRMAIHQPHNGLVTHEPQEAFCMYIFTAK